MVATFCTKFFITEPKLGIEDLSNDPQRKDEALVDYVTGFKERTLACKEMVSKASLIGIYVKGMQTKS